MFGELDDLVEALADLGPAHAEDGAVEEDVLAPGQLGVEAGPDLEQRADAAGHLGPAGARLGDPREQFQQRALAGAVVADQADRFAALDLEGDVFAAPRARRSRASRRGRPARPTVRRPASETASRSEP